MEIIALRLVHTNITRYYTWLESHQYGTVEETDEARLGERADILFTECIVDVDEGLQ